MKLDLEVQRSRFTPPGPSILGPQGLRDGGFRPPDWTAEPRETREAWQIPSAEQVAAWVAADPERATLRPKVAACLTWLDVTFGRRE